MDEFLRESSVPGLRYLSSDFGWTTKLVWLLSIVGSFSLAAVIIRENVFDWVDQPAVVTTVDTVDVTDNVPQPMVMLCPIVAMDSTLYSKIFDAFPLNEQEDAEIKTSLALDLLQERVRTRRSKIFDDISQPCLAEESDGEGKGCSFVNTLCRMVEAIGRRDTELLLHDFIFAHVRDHKDEESTHITTQEFEAAMANHSHGKDCSLLIFPSEKNAVVEMYSLFGDAKYGPKPVEEADFSFLHQLLRSDEKLQPSDITYLMYNMGGSYVEVMQTLRRILRSKIHKASGGAVTFADVAAFTHHKSYFSQKTLSHRQACFMRVERDWSVWDGPQVCDSEKIPLICQEYCQGVDRLRSKADFIVDILEMTLPEIDPEGHSENLPVNAHWEKTNGSNREQQWMSIRTEHGPCYTSFQGIESHPKIAGRSSNLGNVMLADKHRCSGLDAAGNGKQAIPLYQVTAAMPGHFAADKLADANEHPPRIEGGMHLRLSFVIKSMSLTSQAFKDMDPDRRGCLYQEERQLRFFSTYTQGNCVLERAWIEAREFCKCQPWYLWNLQLDPSDSTPPSLCEYLGNQCFSAVLAARYDMMTEEMKQACPDDCDLIIYQQVDETTDGFNDIANFPDWCQQRARGKSRKPAVLNQSVCDYAQREQQVNSSSALVSEAPRIWISKAIRTRMAAVTVFVSNRGAFRVIRTATTSLVDMISNIGGTLSLFSGVSAISFLEMLYYLAKGISKRFTGFTRSAKGSKTVSNFVAPPSI